MKKFNLVIKREECPKCHSGAVETRISGKLYAGGEIKQAYRKQEHDLCFFYNFSTASIEDLAAARDILEPKRSAAAEIPGTPRIQVDPEMVQARDPSSSEQPWHEPEENTL